MGCLFKQGTPEDFVGHPIWLSPDSQLQYTLPKWGHASQGLLAALLRFLRSVGRVYDIGVNNGVFAIAAAHLAGSHGRVLAVEADPLLALGLPRTVTHQGNSGRETDFLCAAAHESNGMARFMIASRGRASSGLRHSGRQSQAVQSATCSTSPLLPLALSEIFEGPNVLKMDVEGAEEGVSDGLGGVLRRVGHVDYAEVGHENSEGAYRFLRQFDCRLFVRDLRDERELGA